MNALDSRNIDLGSAFAQKFMKEGTLTFYLGSHGLTFGEPTYRVNVTDATKGTPKTWHIEVRLANKHLVALKTPENIAAGDILLWHTTENNFLRFSVAGSSTTGERFDSRKIADNAVYIHRFGSPGDFEWLDEVGKKARGKIKVTLPAMGTSKENLDYEKALAEGKLVTIENSRVSPSQVDILVGQAVFFAVRKSEGMAIVDKAALDMQNTMKL